jgi:hypothetical protein
MTRAELESLLIALFGSLGAAASALNTSRFTISGWGRKSPVPPAIASLLRLLAAERGVKP